jgi:hypothetical protein
VTAVRIAGRSATSRSTLGRRSAAREHMVAAMDLDYAIDGGLIKTT